MGQIPALLDSCLPPSATTDRMEDQRGRPATNLAAESDVAPADPVNTPRGCSSDVRLAESLSELDRVLLPFHQDCCRKGLSLMGGSTEA